MKRVSLGKLELDPITMEGAIHRIVKAIHEKTRLGLHVVTVNAQFVEIARRDERFARIVRGAELSVADGVPLVWACSLLERPVPERVNGTDLMVRICEAAALESHSVYFLGGRPGAAHGAVERLSERFDGLRVVGVDCPPIGFMNDPKMEEAVSERIRLASPDILFVAFGAPKQEFWIHDHLHLPAKVMVGVGGSFELISGMTKRAPLLWQRTGFEWLWRLGMEPKRLWKRYLVGNTLFVALVLRYWFAGLAGKTRSTPF